MNYLGLRAFACASIVLFTSQWALAAEWRPISLTATPANTSIPTRTYTYVASNFSDDAYPSQFVLSDIPIGPPTAVGQTREMISFSEGMEVFGLGGLPPFVDIAAQTINVSSIWIEVWQAENVVHESCVWTKSGCIPVYEYELRWTPIIGGDFGPLAPVPYTVNPDGTYTATWNPAHSRLSGFDMFAPTDQIAFTFAAAVPEADQSLLFAVGVATLFAYRRRVGRRKSLAPV